MCLTFRAKVRQLAIILWTPVPYQKLKVHVIGIYLHAMLKVCGASTCQSYVTTVLRNLAPQKQFQNVQSKTETPYTARPPLSAVKETDGATHSCFCSLMYASLHSCIRSFSDRGSLGGMHADLVLWRHRSNEDDDGHR